MIKKHPLVTRRIRKINSSFAWIPHQFLRKGFWTSLNHHELLLYLFLVLVADRQGVSYYSFDKICFLLAITTEEYIAARNSLIDKDLIAFDGYLFQVLSLPNNTPHPQHRQSREKRAANEPAPIGRIIAEALGGKSQ